VLHGKHPERIVAEGYWDEATGERFRVATERVLAGESDDERVQLTTTLSDGSTVTTETRLTPPPTEEAAGGSEGPTEVVGLVGVIRDVTERVERENELARLNERLERLSGFLSHDLNPPPSRAGIWMWPVIPGTSTVSTPQMTRSTGSRR